jgi:hypothetical protein
MLIELRLQWRVPVTTLEVRVTYLTFHRLTRRVPPVRPHSAQGLCALAKSKEKCDGWKCNGC